MEELKMPNIDTITQFLDTINNNANGNYHNADYIVNQYFSADDGAGHPLVAVTEHGAPAGPAFHGTQKIKKFFRRLFNAFPDVTFAPLNPGAPLFLTSADGNTIALQTTVGGHHQDWWFPQADPDNYHSLPLSNIPPNDGQITIPACQVFTFVAQSKIQQLAFYMDRYHFITNLGPPTF
jgi:SnoaL-like domain